MKLPTALLACAAVLPLTARAQEKPLPSNTPTGLFGFMDDSSVIARGAINPKYGFFPAWSAHSQTLTQRMTLNYGVSDVFEAGVSAIYAQDSSSGSTADTTVLGLSAPMQYVFVTRVQNGTGFALVATPTITRNRDPLSRDTTGWTLDNHLVLDHDFGGKYFLGMNVGYTLAGDTRSEANGAFYLQGGGTIKFTDWLYWGVQLQLSQQLVKPLHDPSGWAAFVGTSVSLPVTKHLTFAAAYMRQIAGGERTNPIAHLNTQSFSRDLAQVVVSLGF